MYSINELKFKTFKELVEWAEKVHRLIQLIPPSNEVERQRDCIEITARINKDTETLLELAQSK